MAGSALASIVRISDGFRVVAVVMAIVLLAVMTALPAYASKPKTAALVMDAHTGKILYSRSADELRYPASLTKVMTLYLLFEKLEKREITLDSRITMTQRGANQPPSKLGLRVGQTIRVEDAIYSLVTRSANDVASATGAFIAGTEANFAQVMTKKARELGMTRTTYRNASGLPDRAQLTTARDQATLALRMHKDFPQYYHYFSTENFTWGRSNIRNHNRLLGDYRGTTGLKTGYTNASGFNLTATVERDDKFLIGVVMGGEKAQARDKHMVEILDRAMPQAIAMKTSRTQFAAAAPPPVPVTRPEDAAGVVAAEDRAALQQLASTVDQNEGAYAEGDASTATPLPTPVPVMTAALTEPAPAAARKPAAPVDSVTAYATAALRSAEGVGRQAGREIGNFLVAPANASISPDAVASPLIREASLDPARTAPAAQQTWRDGDPLIPDGTWIIQIGAYADQADAVGSIRKALRAAPGELGAAVPVTIPVKTADNRTLYRSRFGGFDNETAAKTACGRLARQSIPCIAIPPANWSLPQSAKSERG